MVVSAHKQREVPSAVQQLQGGRLPASSKAVQGQVGLRENTVFEGEQPDNLCGWMKKGEETHVVSYGLRMVYTLDPLTAHNGLFLVAEGL